MSEVLNELPKQEASQEDLQKLLEELWQIEKELFSESDWIVDWSSGDSIVDQQYYSIDRDYSDIWVKVNLVKALIETLKEPDLLSIFWSKEYNNTIKEYPQAKELVDSFIIRHWYEFWIIWTYWMWHEKKFFTSLNKILENIGKYPYLLGILESDNKFNNSLLMYDYFEYEYFRNTGESGLAFMKNISWLNLESDKRANRITESNENGFYIERVMWYESIKEISKKDNWAFLRFCVTNYKWINNLEQFDYLLQNKKSFDEIYEYVIKQDISLQEKFVKAIDIYNKWDDFSKFFIERKKNEQFWYIDNTIKNQEDREYLKRELAFLSSYEINVLKPLIENSFNIEDKSNVINYILEFINNLFDKGFITTNHHFQYALTYIALIFKKWRTDDSIFSKIQDKIINLSNNNFRRNIGNIKNSDADLENQYKNICETYIDRNKDWESISLWVYLQKCKIQQNWKLESIPPDDIQYIETTVLWESNRNDELETRTQNNTNKNETTTPLEDKYSEYVDELTNAWATIDENWNLKISSPINLWVNETIKMWQNWELIYMNSLWYTFNFDKNLNTSGEKLFEIRKQMDFYDRVWFWYFWSDFRKMIEIIQSNSSLIWWTVWISINEWIWNENDFLSISETQKICEIFKKLWFLDASVDPNNLTNESVSKAQFVYKTQEMWEKYWENNFYLNWTFNQQAFREVIISEYSKK